MCGIFTYIWLMFMVNVGKYTIHGSYGIVFMLYSNFKRYPTWKLSIIFYPELNPIMYTYSQFDITPPETSTRPLVEVRNNQATKTP